MSAPGDERAPADRLGNDRERFEDDDTYRSSLSIRERTLLRNALNSATIDSQLSEIQEE